MATHPVSNGTPTTTDRPLAAHTEDADLIAALTANNEALVRLIRELQVRVSMLEAVVHEAVR